MCAENSMVHGMVRNQPQINQRGACGSCAQGVPTPGAHVAANDKQVQQHETADSGMARTFKPAPRPAAPGQGARNLTPRPDDVGSEERPTRRWRKLAKAEQEDLASDPRKRNSRESPKNRRNTKQAARISATRQSSHGPPHCRGSGRMMKWPSQRTLSDCSSITPRGPLNVCWLSPPRFRRKETDAATSRRPTECVLDNPWRTSMPAIGCGCSLWQAGGREPHSSIRRTGDLAVLQTEWPVLHQRWKLRMRDCRDADVGAKRFSFCRHARPPLHQTGVADRAARRESWGRTIGARSRGFLRRDWGTRPPPLDLMEYYMTL